MTEAFVAADGAACGMETTSGVDVITAGVAASVQSLFDVHAAIAAGETSLEAATAAGSSAFAALARLSAFVVSNTQDASTSLAGINFDYGAGPQLERPPADY